MGNECAAEKKGPVFNSIRFVWLNKKTRQNGKGIKEQTEKMSAYCQTTKDLKWKRTNSLIFQRFSPNFGFYG